MAILDLQRTIAEAGRIRIGETVADPNSRTGTRPAKLDTFRLTSPDKQAIERAAELFGGKVEPWQAPAGPQWEVVTETAAIDVIVPPSAMAFSQYLELWAAGGCQRRCDGSTELRSEQPCLCDPADRECDFHTRLSVMIRDLPGLALWRLDTQGWYAARELAGAVEILMLAAGRGVLLPARLLLEQRSVKRIGKNGKTQTFRFPVPRLDPGITPGQLVAGQISGLQLQAIADGLPPEAARPPLTPVPRLEGPRPSIAEQSAPPPAPPARRNAAPEIPTSGRRRASGPKAEGAEGYWRARAFAEGAERGIDAERMRGIAAMRAGVEVAGFSMTTLDEGDWEAIHKLILGFPLVDPESASAEAPAPDAPTQPEPVADLFAAADAEQPTLVAILRDSAASSDLEGGVTEQQKDQLQALLAPLGVQVALGGIRAAFGIELRHLTASQAQAVLQAAGTDDFPAKWRAMAAEAA